MKTVKTIAGTLAAMALAAAGCAEENFSAEDLGTVRQKGSIIMGGNGADWTGGNGADFYTSNGNSFSGSNGSTYNTGNGLNWNAGNGVAFSGSNGNTFGGSNGVDFIGGNGWDFTSSNGLAFASGNGVNWAGGNGVVLSTSNGVGFTAGNGANYTIGNGTQLYGSNGWDYTTGNGLDFAAGNGIDYATYNGLNYVSSNGANLYGANGWDYSAGNGVAFTGANGHEFQAGNGIVVNEAVTPATFAAVSAAPDGGGAAVYFLKKLAMIYGECSPENPMSVHIEVAGSAYGTVTVHTDSLTSCIGVGTINYMGQDIAWNSHQFRDYGLQLTPEQHRTATSFMCAFANAEGDHKQIALENDLYGMGGKPSAWPNARREGVFNGLPGSNPLVGNIACTACMFQELYGFIQTSQSNDPDSQDPRKAPKWMRGTDDIAYRDIGVIQPMENYLCDAQITPTANNTLCVGSCPSGNCNGESHLWTCPTRFALPNSDARATANAGPPLNADHSWLPCSAGGCGPDYRLPGVATIVNHIETNFMEYNFPTLAE